MLFIINLTSLVRYLRDSFSTLYGDHVTFLRPSHIQGEEILRDPQSVTNYVRDAFLSEIEKGERQAKYILAPYLQELVSFLSQTFYYIYNYFD